MQQFFYLLFFNIINLCFHSFQSMQEKLSQEKLIIQKMTNELEEKERHIEQLNKTLSEVSKIAPVTQPLTTPEPRGTL